MLDNYDPSKKWYLAKKPRQYPVYRGRDLREPTVKKYGSFYSASFFIIFTAVSNRASGFRV